MTAKYTDEETAMAYLLMLVDRMSFYLASGAPLLARSYGEELEKSLTRMGFNMRAVMTSFGEQVSAEIAASHVPPWKRGQS